MSQSLGNGVKKYLKKFKKIYVEITNVCNLNCDFCPKTSREPNFMKRDLFEKILEEIKDYTDYLYLHVLGEPLMHPDLIDFLNISKNLGYKVNITTNGTLINSALKIISSDKYKETDLIRQINISMHSFDANTITILLDEYIENIINFVKYASENTNIISSLRLWNIEDNKSDKNRHILKKLEEAFRLGNIIEEKLSKGTDIKLCNNSYLNQASKFDWPDLKLLDINNNGFCYGLRDQAAILVDGTVVPCCLDNEGTINLGNIKNTPFDVIINSKRAADFYKGFSSRNAVEPLCQRCTYKNRFDN
jgi:radical SAM protein with 4Fe4S-binding SPASM domain